MLKLHTGNLRKIDSNHGLSKTELGFISERLKPYLKEIHAREQGFYKVIDDKATVKKIEKFVRETKGKYDDVIVLGIGGSSLGTICLQQSLKHLFVNVKTRTDHLPYLYVLDNIDPALMLEIQDVINLPRTLFIVVTKSGGTPEVLSQYFYFRDIIEKNKLNPKEHFVFVTDPEKGLLRKISKTEDIPIFDVPANVGGRFSVQTAVGLLPAAMVGIDIKKMLKGAQEMREHFLSTSVKNNLSFQLAGMQYLLHTKGKIMNVMLPYAQHLISFADWYRQLLAESIGKAMDETGKKVNTGITPIKALGVTDQHSQGQLYNEGPNDKFFIFIEVEKLAKPVKVPNLYPKDPTVAFLKKTSFNELIAIEKKATSLSLTKNDRPNITITIPEINAYYLGQLFLLFEGATAFLGEFFNINAFNQPGVELSKQLTKQYLLKKK